jgi:hypothetical protein
VHLLPHLCRHHVPVSVRGALALSSHALSRHEKLIAECPELGHKQI